MTVPLCLVGQWIIGNHDILCQLATSTARQNIISKAGTLVAPVYMNRLLYSALSQIVNLNVVKRTKLNLVPSACAEGRSVPRSLATPLRPALWTPAACNSHGHIFLGPSWPAATSKEERPSERGIRDGWMDGWQWRLITDRKKNGERSKYQGVCVGGGGWDWRLLYARGKTTLTEGGWDVERCGGIKGWRGKTPKTCVQALSFSQTTPTMFWRTKASAFL